MPVTWKEVSEDRYDEMLGVVPPEIMVGYGFLVGEPYSHRTCRLMRKIYPTFQAFKRNRDGTQFWEASEPLTRAEFKDEMGVYA